MVTLLLTGPDFAGYLTLPIPRSAKFELPPTKNNLPRSSFFFFFFFLRWAFPSWKYPHGLQGWAGCVCSQVVVCFVVCFVDVCSFSGSMHPRNRYLHSPPDFASLASRYPAFAKQYLSFLFLLFQISSKRLSNITVLFRTSLARQP